MDVATGFPETGYSDLKCVLYTAKGSSVEKKIKNKVFFLDFAISPHLPVTKRYDMAITNTQKWFHYSGNTKLYEQTTPDQLTTLTSSPGKEEIPPLLEEEAKEALDEMKKKKAPRNDGITSDAMRVGGPQVIKYMTKVYNEALKDYEKAFDSVEHAAIVQALIKVNINENYVTIIENIYKGATARIHIDNQISEAFEIQRGVRQGDPISPKLFTTVIEQIFKKADLKYGINR
ncbi:endonuclease-reverse transcriptase [Plakobranchus ocellatus]|uniref:Endonuclease-reverse transcriptase n=1 Tax=Plakobranchus ocellatus TaxID=259542 RepID=A0AAV3YKS1_9GAST|nr:endonuclease-reverse transcriptase [Plakobranchus ocellatus]